ncbi:proton channel OtopLc-like isoform X3 [Frankliniella occidentalis]|uniref:Proton channel OtopLc-like isoform X3 n=1 Tax=Frankliniella occidentalis TaxID=133901 RepID=A0A6J1S1C1_FRAOC|nr:proton channel OtopLc-like isoform X3 [Frankliniella occidentalis]
MRDSRGGYGLPRGGSHHDDDLAHVHGHGHGHVHGNGHGPPHGAPGPGDADAADAHHFGRLVYNEHHERDSLNGAGSSAAESPTGLGGLGGLGALGGLGGLGGLQDKGGVHGGRCGRLRGGRTFLNLLSGGRANVSADMLEHTEPFCHLWVTLSSLYGKLVIVFMLAFCLTEVMDNPVRLLSLQGVFLMYLYVGSIAVIICIYIWVLMDSCASLHHGDPRRPSALDPECGHAMSRFGSLKRAHISRDKTSGTSFYLRVGALAFGLGTLVFNGLEMAMHSMMEGSCLNDVVFVHPVLHGLFTFLQMHFLFVNSQVLVERFGLAARFGFMHLAATNLALWIRLVVWESGNEWTYFVYLAQSDGYSYSYDGRADHVPTPLQLRGFPRSVTDTMAQAAQALTAPRSRRDLGLGNGTFRSHYQPVSDSHISQVVSLHQCLNTNSLGQLWTSSMPFLYPFIIQFSLIAAAVTFVMGQQVGRDRLPAVKHRKGSSGGVLGGKACGVRGAMHAAALDCAGASKGLFLGLLCLVAGIVVIIIFLVVKEDTDFPAETVFWLTTGALATVLTLSILMTAIGLVQVRKLSHSGREPSALDRLLSSATVAGVQLYTVFGIVVGAAGVGLVPDILKPATAFPDGASVAAPPDDDGVLTLWPPMTPDQRRHAMLLAVSALQMVQASMQSTMLAEALRRTSITRHQAESRPARQVVTFLLCTNAVLWAYDTFVTQSWLSQELQLRFYGVLAWGVVSRVGLPLLVFYRFHSCVLLLDVWRRCYQAPPRLQDLLDPGN